MIPQKKVIKESRYSYKDASKKIASFLGMEWSEKFYQHFMQGLDGKVSFTIEESEALEVFVNTLNDPFYYSKSVMALVKIPNLLSRYKEIINGHAYNRHHELRRIREVEERL